MHGARASPCCLPAFAQSKGKIYYLVPTLLDEFQTGIGQRAGKVPEAVGYEMKTLNADNKTDAAAKPDERRHQAEARGDHSGRGRFQRAQAVDREGARRRHSGHDFDRQITSTPSDFTSVAGTVEIGYVAAGEIQRLLKEKNGVGEGQDPAGARRPGDPYTLDIQKGFEEKMKAFPDVQIISLPGHAVGSRAMPAPSSPTSCVANPDIDLIFVHAAHLAVAAVASLEAKGKKPGDVMLMSSNGAPVGLDLIRKGWEHVEVEQPLYAQAAAVAMFCRQGRRTSRRSSPANMTCSASNRRRDHRSLGPEHQDPGCGDHQGQCR